MSLRPPCPPSVSFCLPYCFSCWSLIVSALSLSAFLSPYIVSACLPSVSICLRSCLPSVSFCLPPCWSLCPPCLPSFFLCLRSCLPSCGSLCPPCLPSVSFCLPSCWSLCPPCLPSCPGLVSLLVGHCVRLVSLLSPFSLFLYPFLLVIASTLSPFCLPLSPFLLGSVSVLSPFCFLLSPLLSPFLLVIVSALSSFFPLHVHPLSPSCLQPFTFVSQPLPCCLPALGCVSLAILYIVICLPVSTFVCQLWTAVSASALQSFTRVSQLWAAVSASALQSFTFVSQRWAAVLTSLQTARILGNAVPHAVPPGAVPAQ